MKPHFAPLIGTTLAIVTIITCYLTATSLGHVVYWLPDITHTGLHAPERFFFRIGFLPACLLFTISWHLIAVFTSPLKHHSLFNQHELLLDESLQKSISSNNTTSTRVTNCEVLSHKIGCWLGQFAGIMLFIGSAVMEEPTETLWDLHIICASGFFLVTFVANILFLYSVRKHSIISSTSIRLKSIFIFIQFLLIMANIITTIVQNSEGKTRGKTRFPGGPFIEWLITISQLCFYVSFVTDLKLLQAKLIIDDMDLIKRD